MHARTLVFLTAFVPCAALVGSYLMSATLGHVPWCVPLVEGCTSISRAARRGDTIYYFRALMMPASVLLAIYWVYVYRWLRALGDTDSKIPMYIRNIGIAGALFLIFYIDFLGTSGDVYRFMRKSGVVVYFACTALCQLLLVSRLYQLRSSYFSQRLSSVRNWKFFVCALMLLFALAQIGVEVTMDQKYEANNIIEWNFAILMHLYFLLTAKAWRLTGFSTSFTCETVSETPGDLAAVEFSGKLRAAELMKQAAP